MSIQPQFCDHEVVQRFPDDYTEITTSPSAILDAWSMSLFAHEILSKDGSIKPESEMTEATLDRYLQAVSSLKKGENLSKPVLGVGIMDGVEIGIGREIIAACITLGVSEITFHVRQGQVDDIKTLLAI